MSQRDPADTRILVVDDEPLLREFLEDAFRRKGYGVVLAASAADALRAIGADPPDVVLLDIRMKGRDGLDLLPDLRRRCPDTPVIMMTGHATVEAAIQAMRAGAFDFLTKPFSADTIELAVGRALAVGALRRENSDLRSRLSLQESLNVLIGRSRAMENLRASIRLVAPTRSTVLITGESGTGKELVARAIHEGSPRHQATFIKINCAAVPAGLLESELFGHERGAFTGATGRARGRFEQADGGTLLLDEISEMEPALQPKLLRALQEREFYRVGGSVPLSVDVRVLATSNADLKARVREGSFREDLYYRLEVVPLRVPPLRERREDVPVLAEHFLALLREEVSRPSLRLGRRAGERLLQHEWPGNVRELRNAIERAVILCSGEELEPQHFVLDGMEGSMGDFPMSPPGDTLWEREKHWILQVLQEERGNRTAAARRLGVSVRTIRNKLAAYALEKTPEVALSSSEGRAGGPGAVLPFHRPSERHPAAVARAISGEAGGRSIAR